MNKYYKMDENLLLTRIKLGCLHRGVAVILVALIFVLTLNSFKPEPITESVVLHTTDTMYIVAHDTTPLTKENLWTFINQCEIQFPNVVYQQFIAETNHLKSKSCLIANNLGGFKVEPSSRYENTYHIKGVKYLNHLVFPTWQYCVMHYKEFQKANFDKKPKNYYMFLKSQGYAESPLYINLLKSIDVPSSIKK